jgi:Domain of unknown function (DUF4281)
MTNNSTPLEEKLHPLLLGLNALELWDYLNLIMISYALMVFAPRWRHTPTLTLVVPCLLSILYVSSLISAIQNDKNDEKIDFFTFQGVLKAFENPNVVFAGWVHYIVFDCLVARMIFLDSIQRGASILMHFVVVVPCMFGTLMVGPTGFLLYTVLRQIALPLKEPETRKDDVKVKVF